MSIPARSIVIILALLTLGALPVQAAGNLSDTERFAWAENAGWLNWKTTHGRVTVHEDHLVGHAWAENIGWVKLGSDGGGPYANTSASDWGVNRDVAGNLSGYAWSENVGWINVAPTHGGVAIDPLSGDFSGFAWAENVGFIHLANPAPAYKVQLVYPQLPPVVTSVPEAGTWSNDVTVDVEWSGATGSDLGFGYSFLFDTSPSTIPDQVVEMPHGVDPHSTTSAPLANGDSHWFHLRGCDPVGNCSPALHLGPFMIDTTAPSAVTNLASTSHAIDTPTSDDTVDVAWTAADDNLSGSTGYGVEFSASDTWTCDQVQDTADTSATSAPLADGSWYVHVCAVDAAGNWGAVASAGPYQVDTTPPQVHLVHSVRDTGDGVLRSGELTWASITQLYVSLDEIVLDVGGGSQPDDVTNTDNWLLVSAGPDGVAETVSCAGPAGDDVPLAVDQVSWDEPSLTARLAINGGVQLSRSRYRVLACGTTSIVDSASNALDGDGDGVGGDDFWQEWSISDNNLLTNSNLDQDLADWDRSSVSEIVWGSDDAGSAPTSGSVAMTNLTGAGHELRVSQCVAVDDSQGEWAAGWAWLDSGLGGAPSAYAEITWYASEGCAGTVLGTGSSLSAVGDSGSAWTPFEGWFDTPAGALSAEVSFMVAAGASEDFQANLDDLLVLEMLWGDGFESGDTSAWSGVVP